ncbi:MAG: LysR family transcriptional regulator [Pigmentiphaga sp.]|nr:LysR family transcriptional regulator [Pigmentiphaga sp.]
MTFDLNLLRILTTLNEHRSVSRAAEQLGMSQPGFSTALARLRRHIGDPLFVRTSEGMQPTPRAMRMIDSATQLLQSVEHDILEAPPFQPETLVTRYRVALADVAVQAFVPHLMRRIWQVAPQVSIDTPMLPPGELERALEAGEIDLAIGYFPDLNKDSLLRQRLFTHTFACLMNGDRPLAGDQLSREAFSSIGHAVADAPLRSEKVYDAFLARQRIERRVVITTPHFLSLPHLVADLDVLATVPISLAMVYRDHPRIRVVRPPFVPPTFVVSQHWHRRYHQDPRNRWLREHFAQLFGQGEVWLPYARELYGELPPPVDP